MSIANNTLGLEDILAAVNELPEAGAGDPVLQEKTATPMVSTQQITPDSGYDGLSKVTVDGDGNFVAGNLKSGVTIWGVTGTYAGEASGDDGVKALIERTATTLAIPAGVINIGDFALYKFTSLTAITIPDGVIRIGQSAFRECRGLLEITIPGSVTTVDSYAFRECKALTSVTFQGTPTSMPGTVFNQCTALTDVYVPWAEGAVANAPWNADSATIHYNYTGG